MAGLLTRNPLLLAPLLGLGLSSPSTALSQAATARVAPDSEIHRLIAQRVETLAAGDGSIGIVVGVLDRGGRRIIAYGHRGKGDPHPLDGNTGFEIGSVTKVFTALLLADMVHRGQMALSDPVTRYLPPDEHVPERGGRQITVVDLATHTSGLPFMPDDLPAFETSARGRYTVEQFHAFLSRYQLPRDIGAQWEYSNVGYALLGDALASRGGADFETLLRSRVVRPLGLTHTMITRTPAYTNIARGHDAALQGAPPITTVPAFAVMPAAGSVTSTANDLLTVLSVAMGIRSSPLSPAMAALLATRRPTGDEGLTQALGWWIAGDERNPLIFHDGGTFGYASSVAWDPRTRIGVVVLSNQVTAVGDIARHLVRPQMPLDTPRSAKHVEIAVDTMVLDRYVGRYDSDEEGAFTVARAGRLLTITLPASWGLPRLRLHAESERDFYAAELPLRATFETNSAGHVSRVLVYPPSHSQRPVPANRVDSGASSGRRR